MAIAYVVQKPLKREGGIVVPRIDYNTITPYGDIRFLFEWGEYTQDDDLLHTDEIVWRLRAALSGYSDQDYIVPLGSPVLISMAVMLAAECNHGRVRILDWIRDEARYRVVDIDLNCQPIS